MEVGGIAGQLVHQHPLGVVEQGHELFLAGLTGGPTGSR